MKLNPVKEFLPTMLGREFFLFTLKLLPLALPSTTFIELAVKKG